MTNAPETIRRALRATPDLPRWIEARAILLSGQASVFESERGRAIRNDAPGGGLVVLVDRPDPELIERALSDRPQRELLCAAEDAEHVARHFPSWKLERVVLHELHDAMRLAPRDDRVRLLRTTDSLADLPNGLRDELARSRAAAEIWTAFERKSPASFAYAYWRTERWFDISIDTAPDFRRRGLAWLAVSELIRHELARGLQPVWGAFSSNAASLALARSLGFVETDELVSATRA